MKNCFRRTMSVCLALVLLSAAAGAACAEDVEDANVSDEPGIIGDEDISDDAGETDESENAADDGDIGFPDAAGHWASAALKRAVNEEYLTGFEDGTLRPNEPLTAAQLLSILARSRQYPKPAPETTVEAPADAWYYTAGCQAVDAGLIDGEFTGFDDPVTRREAMLITGLAYGIGEPTTVSVLAPFADAELLSEEERTRMAGLVQRGLVQGWDGFLHLEDDLTRAEFVTLLYRMEDFDEETWVEETITAQMPGSGRDASPEEIERVLALVTSAYAGDYTTEWAETRDYTVKEKEIWVNAKGYTSHTGLLVWVNLTYQRANIFDYRDGHWTLLRCCLVGTGAPGTATPQGVWQITYHNAAGWTTGTYSVSPVVGFKGGGYAFHSRLCWPGTRTVYDYSIGYPISHGCVRMYHEDIDWFYENITDETTVVVF
ncbi:MAG: L,D-transpeptidase family protein [Eubacteriales bacterium]|nr:L,D-transpeptidase family protein [Eubacteriales bacterium]